MKKFYLLSLLCCISLAAFSQITTTIYATGASGSYITGTASSTGVRADGAIIATNSATPRRGYAVFDIASAGIPAGATVMSVVAGFNVSSYTGGTTTVCSTNVFVGDLSLVTAPLTLYADMTTPAATNVSTVSYGAGTGLRTIATTPAAVGLVQANLTGKLSYCWTNTGTAIYTITGETGTASTSGTHAPYLLITYCPRPTAVTATASPIPVCAGSTLTLSGSASVSTGTLTYQWDGPGGYTGAGAATTASASSTGVYTLTAVNTCGVATASTTATTASVTVNPLPAAISGATALCTTGSTTTTLTDADAGGTWSSSAGSVAAIGSATGDVTAGAAGTATITYTLPTGCYITSPMAVNSAPAAISGPAEVCEGSTITLIDGSSGGAWSATGSATVGAATGIVTGSTGGGPSTISYTIPGCAAATYDVTVNPLPSPLLGPATVCQGATITLTETATGGTWSSSDASVAAVSSTGIVTGGTPGSATITYTLPTGCLVTHGISVNALPAAISGPTSVCRTQTISLTDATSGGGWFTSDATVAPVSFTGTVTGLAMGTATITYRVFSTGCYVTAPITVYPLPAAITGPTTVCSNATITLSDTDPGGTWSSGSTIIATVGSATGIVSGVAAGTVGISYTIPTGCYVVTPVFVNAAPTAVIIPAGPTTFCAGGSVLLNATPGAGNLYQWFNAGGAIAGATTTNYLASTSDVFVVRVINPATCSTTSAPITVSAALSPVITMSKPSTSFCNGDHIVLTANTGGAVGAITYQWQRNGVDIPLAVGPSYVATTSGKYICIVSISGGASGACVATTPDVTITVYALPTPVVSYNGVSLTTTSSYSAYQWFLNTVAIPGAVSRNYSPAISGSYQVRVTDGNTCSGFSTAMSLFNVGVAQTVSRENIRIFPNPAGNTLHIEAPVTVRAVITGLEGKTIIDASDAHDIDLSKLPAGIYMIGIYDGNGQKLLVDKLVKE